MNDAIHRAAQPGATASSVLNTPSAAPRARGQQQRQQQQQNAPPPIHSLEHTADSDAYFAALLNRPSILSPRGAVGLLALTAPYFVATVAPASDEEDENEGSDVDPDNVVDDVALPAVDAAAGGGGGEGKDDEPHPPSRPDDRGATPEQCGLYLRAIAEHGPSLADAIRDGGFGLSSPDARCALEAVRAAGCAAVACGQNRMEVSTSGVIPALARLVDVAAGTSDKKVDGGGGSGSASGWSGVITAVHPELMQCCLAAGQYRYASNFARSHPVLSVAPPPAKSTSSSSRERNEPIGGNCQVDTEQFLRYHYLLGMVRCGCEDFDGAVEAFDVCVTMPSRMVSAITIAARKKMLLAACLSRKYSGFHKGEAECLALFDPSSAAQSTASTSGGGSTQVEQAGTATAGGGNGGGGAGGGAAQQSSSSSTSSSSVRTCRAFSKWPYAVPPSTSNVVSTFISSGGWGLREYDRLISSFLRGDVSSFVSVRNEMSRVLSEDGNAGLAGRLEDELCSRAVRKVAAVYEAMPLDDLASKLGRYLQPSSSSSESCRFREGETIEDWAVRVVSSAASASGSTSSRVVGVGVVRADFAKIDQADGTAYFHPLPPSLVPPPPPSGAGVDDADVVARELSGRIGEMAALAERVRDLDVAVATSTKYRAAIAKKESSSKVGAVGGGGAGGQQGQVQQQGASFSRSVAEAAVHGHGPGGYRPEYMGR